MDSDAGVEDALENVGGLDLLASEAGFFAHDQPLKRRTAASGGLAAVLTLGV